MRNTKSRNGRKGNNERGERTNIRQTNAKVNGMEDKPIRVLLVEDNPGDFRLIQEMLKESKANVELKWAQQLSAGLANLKEEMFDVLLVDLGLPDSQGIDTFKKIHDQAPQLPVVVLTGLADDGLAMRVVRDGAQDYLGKSQIDSNLLIRAIRYAIERYENLEQLRRTRVALALSETRFRNMIEKDADGILIVDSNGTVRFANPAAEVFFSCKAEEFLGHLLGFPLVAGETTEIDIVPGKAGEIIAEMRVVETDWEGEPAYLASLRDITERKRILEKLEQTRQQELQLKDQFLSHVSHELRSPLSVIHQFVTILLDKLAGNVNAQQSEFLEITLQNVNQLRTMIDHLLDVTRAGTGKLTFEPRVISIAEVVAETLETFQATSTERGVTLLADIPGVLPLIFADPQRLRQILINLIDNAFKFTPKEGTITVRAQVFDQDPEFLCMTVVDTGCGINSDDTKHIFDRLFQGSNLIDSARKGLGLGLYICKELVSLHGGKIWAESQKGKGSTFSFTMPILSLAKLFVSIPKDLLTGPMALIAVEIFPAAKRLLMGDDEVIIQEVRNVLTHCILLDRDVLLPRVSSPQFGENFLIVACTEQKGAEALVRRIRGQITNCEKLQNTEFHTTISFTMVNTPPNSNAMPWVHLAKYIFNSIEGKMKRAE